jgi:hypothetical protein
MLHTLIIIMSIWFAGSVVVALIFGRLLRTRGHARLSTDAAALSPDTSPSPMGQLIELRPKANTAA